MAFSKRAALGVVLVVATLLSFCSGSAIPMWEYLSRGEKMSHLYSMFAKQVSGHCKNSQDMPTNMCKRNLLMYGINKLQDMNESHLDSMDPYQRGAHDIIWDAMMDGHTMKGKKKNHPTTQAPALIVRGQYDHNPLFDEPNGQQNRKQDSNGDSYGIYDEYSNAASAQDLQFAAPQNNRPSVGSSVFDRYQGAASMNFDNLAPVEQNTNFLSGPMVVRLRPDGTPVDETHHSTLPKDDDIKEMTIGQERMPTFHQIYANLKHNEDAHDHHGLPSTTETATPLSATGFFKTYRTEYRLPN
ncbi:rhythmically expressed gene 5 protein [Topomyia yanbarensis]|uniref:rhythmically expressed gene 5 protein n=1 Tax=Topomyia yanbarensis TaxID=2498891 RepID=UPI00273C0E93|nr:rhythmically expressed gene 5 protein [Topomyia yanbarensis]